MSKHTPWPNIEQVKAAIAIHHEATRLERERCVKVVREVCAGSRVVGAPQLCAKILERISAEASHG